MIKLALKHWTLDKCIDLLFNAVRKNFSTPERIENFEEFKHVHIGDTFSKIFTTLDTFYPLGLKKDSYVYFDPTVEELVYDTEVGYGILISGEEYYYNNHQKQDYCVTIYFSDGIEIFR